MNSQQTNPQANQQASQANPQDNQQASQANPQDNQQASQANQAGYEFDDIENDEEFFSWFHNEYFNMPNEEGKLNPQTKFQLSDGVLDLLQLSMMIPGFEQYQASREIGRINTEAQKLNAEWNRNTQQLHRDASKAAIEAGGFVDPEVRKMIGEVNQSSKPTMNEKTGWFENGGSALPVPNIQNTTVDARTTVNTGQQNQEDPNKQTFAQYYNTTLQKLVENDLKNGTIKILQGGNVKEITDVDFNTMSSERAFNLNDDNSQVTVTYKDGTKEMIPAKDLAYHNKIIDTINRDPKITNGFQTDISKLNSDFQKRFNGNEQVRNIVNSSALLTQDSIREFFGTGDAIANKALQRFNGMSETQQAAGVALVNKVLKSKLFENMVKTGYASREALAEFNDLVASSKLSNENGIKLLSDMIEVLTSSYGDPFANQAGMYKMDSQKRDLDSAVEQLRLMKLIYEAKDKSTGWFGESDNNFAKRINSYKVSNENGYTKIITNNNGGESWIVDLKNNRIFKYNAVTKQYDPTDENPYNRK